MQFQVPQFIETEDTVVGPFTLRQFIYIGIAGVISGMLYFLVQTWLWTIISAIIFGLAFAFAFIKVQGRSFFNIALSAFHFYWKPQTYVWQPEYRAITAAEKRAPEENDAALEKVISGTTVGKIRKPAAPVATERISRKAVSAGLALHKSWEDLQTGAPLATKNSDRQFLEKKMAERYQIFQKLTGDRKAARRIDYR